MARNDTDALLARFRKDFKFYAPKCLRIRTKEGKILPFILNDAQRYIHARIEEQKARTGKVRAIVLKGRQQGCSTYVEGRFYWKTSGEFGKRTFILTHEQAATDNLFELAQRYHENCPPELQPHTSHANSKELFFDLLDSGYKVATAGSKDAGRSNTAQYFHGSEVAFWPNAETHMAGLGQAIPNMPGTEMILESTANGPGNLFHKMWLAAESGDSEYIAIFVPWFWQQEYRLPCPADFRLTPEEYEYMNAHKLDLEQMAWRRAKIRDDFGGDDAWFRQEYPAIPSEAFVAVGVESYIPSRLVLQSRKRNPKPEAWGALVIGVDPARFGDDKSGIIRRRGRVAFKPERKEGLDTMNLAGHCAMIIREEKPAKMFIDVGGIGAGVYDRLVELGYGNIVVAVNFGGEPINKEKYVNKRAEMWGEAKEWLKDEPNSVPDDDILHGDLTGPQYKYDSNGRVQLESKADMKKRGLKSPDLGDAFCLTFAYPVAVEEPQLEKWKERLKKHRNRNGSAQSA